MKTILFVALLITISIPTWAKEPENAWLVKGSDDYETYKDIFSKSASKLITSGRCKKKDFIEMGGWAKSYNYKDRPVYFTYCGRLRTSNRIYLDVITGEIFK